MRKRNGRGGGCRAGQNRQLYLAMGSEVLEKSSQEGHVGRGRG